MKSIRLIPAVIIILLSVLTVFSSCKKKRTNNENETEIEKEKETETSAENNFAENTDNDLVAIGFQLSENGSLTTFKTSGQFTAPILLSAPCASITPGFTVVNTQTFVNTYTVDFGSTGCLCNDGRIRKGQLFFDFSESQNNAKYYRNPGFKVKITSQGYMVDNHAVQVTQKTVSNITPPISPGPNPGINLKWKIMANITITKPDNKVITWTCDRTKELVNTNDPTCYNGQAFPINWTKAKIKLNGIASGTNSVGEQFTAQATDLLRDFTCVPNANQPHRHPFIAGKIVYTPGARAPRTIDFGGGDCDLNITITVHGQTFAATLP